MTVIPARRAPGRGRQYVLILYGSLAAQLAEFAVYSAAHLPRAVNVAQFVFIASELAAWLGVWRLTRDLTDRRKTPLDERELATRDRAAWLTHGCSAWGLLSSPVATSCCTTASGGFRRRPQPGCR